MKINGIITWGIAISIVFGFPLIKKLFKILLLKIKILVSNNEDLPIGFGYKIMWIAVKTDKKKKIGAIIGLKNLKTSNWKNGIDAAYTDSIFITPTINGWTIAVGIKLPVGDTLQGINNVKVLLKKLSTEFGEAQFFCTHRVVEYHCWVKSINGKIERAYAYIGESGENIVIEGNPTGIESKFNLVNTFSSDAQNDDYFQDSLTYPDEELVMTIAENWSINPTQIDGFKNIKGMGLIGK